MGFLCAKNVYVGKLTENVVKTFCNSMQLFILHVTKLHTSKLSCVNILHACTYNTGSCVRPGSKPVFLRKCSITIFTSLILIKLIDAK